MVHYIIQTIAFQVFFLLIYDVFLKKETFFNWNRFYLLATAFLSIILPFIKIESFKEAVPQQYIISLPEIILGEPSSIINNPILLDTVVIGNSNTMLLWEAVFYLGLIMACCLFLYKLIKVVVLIIKNPKTYKGRLTLVKLVNSNAAFSFFRYVFLGEFLENEEKEAILKHELIHANQKHTVDLLFFEVLRILFWFNPLVYMYQNRITTLHEFIADSEAIKHENKSHYYQNLLAQVFETKSISFINPFFKQSLIKKRIVMLSKTKSKQIHLFKYALLIPMVLGMLVYTSSEAQEITTSEISNTNENRELTDEELKAKLSNEFDNMKSSGAGFTALYEAFSANKDNYLYTREQYYRFMTITEKFLKSDKYKNSGINNKLDKTSYNDYLEFKKTDEAKEIWENNTYDGVIKLVVHDIKKLTPIEQEKKTNKMDLLLRDDFFTKFIMTDGKATVTLGTTESNEDKSKSTDVITIDEIEVPFAVIEQVPVFPGCESLTTNDARKECMSKSVAQHVNTNFNTKLATDLGLKGRQRINVIFKIDTEGSIVNVRSRAPHPGLEEEAIRVIKTLPRMIPGEQKGKVVTVPYSLPIIFQVADEQKEEKLVPLNEVLLDGEVALNQLDEIPNFESCDETLSKIEKKACLDNGISGHVNKNFNTKLATKLGLTGRQRINVIFKIDEEGNITGIRSRASHPDLEAEATRVIKTLPKMIPGELEGKKVTVPYSLPIIFQVHDDTINKESESIPLNEVEVPFSVIDQAPIFTGCEGLEEKEQKKCTSQKVAMHVNKNFNTKLATQLGLIGRQRINVIFKIDTQGNVIDVRSRAPHPGLEEEAIRVIKTLPRMIPGEQKGKVVTVPYSLPIIFQVADKKTND